MFLDIACVMLGQPTNTALRTWGNRARDLHRQLLDANMLASDEGHLAMDKQYQRMGPIFAYTWQNMATLSQAAMPGLKISYQR